MAEARRLAAVGSAGVTVIGVATVAGTGPPSTLKWDMDVGPVCPNGCPVAIGALWYIGPMVVAIQEEADGSESPPGTCVPSWAEPAHSGHRKYRAGQTVNARQGGTRKGK